MECNAVEHQKAQIMVRVPEEIRARLECIAEIERRSLGNTARVLIEESLAARERKECSNEVVS